MQRRFRNILDLHKHINVSLARYFWSSVQRIFSACSSRIKNVLQTGVVDTSHLTNHNSLRCSLLLTVLSESAFWKACNMIIILVPRDHTPFGQHQESQPLARSDTGSLPFTGFPSLCTCSESRLTNLIGSGLNLLCLQSHLKPECCWTGPEVVILGADQKELGLWARECMIIDRKHLKCTELQSSYCSIAVI